MKNNNANENIDCCNNSSSNRYIYLTRASCNLIVVSHSGVNRTRAQNTMASSNTNTLAQAMSMSDAKQQTTLVHHLVADPKADVGHS